MKKVEIGDILRIKREEKPDDAFWAQFDRDLDQKRLSALVQGPSFGVRVIQGLAKILAPVLPVAGVATLTMMVFTADSTTVEQLSEAPMVAEVASSAPYSGSLDEHGGQAIDFIALKVGAKNNYIKNAISLRDDFSGSVNRVMSTKGLSVGLKRGVSYGGSDLSRTGLVVASLGATQY